MPREPERKIPGVAIVDVTALETHGHLPVVGRGEAYPPPHGIGHLHVLLTVLHETLQLRLTVDQLWRVATSGDVP
jgi:hypothetical protein